MSNVVYGGNSMNHFNKHHKISIDYTNPHCILQISNFFYSRLNMLDTNIIVLCIGTDRSTGDSYGPLTGTLLSHSKLRKIDIIGTLNSPVHALNIDKTIQSIYQSDPTPFIIAIDASLGQSKSVGQIIYGVGQIEPGKAVKKKLPPIGDMFITSIVNIGGLMEYTILQSTRLSLVYKLAYKTAKIIQLTDFYLSRDTHHLSINER